MKAETGRHSGLFAPAFRNRSLFRWPLPSPDVPFSFVPSGLRPCLLETDSNDLQTLSHRPAALQLHARAVIWSVLLSGRTIDHGLSGLTNRSRPERYN